MIHTVPSPAAHKIVSREEWLKARMALLAKEKEETRLRDQINGMRLTMPWVKVEKDYVFETPEGQKRLGDLFEGRSQLVVYHFMLGPNWEAGCPGCSHMADHMDGPRLHLNNHDVTLIAVSRGPLAKITAYKRRMGWHFPWVSSFGSDFNFDFNVSFDDAHGNGERSYNFRPLPSEFKGDESHGLSAFYKNEKGEIFHTYSSYARGVEEMVGSLMFLDRAPLGRNEESGHWVKRHDEYVTKPAAS